MKRRGRPKEPAPVKTGGSGKKPGQRPGGRKQGTNVGENFDLGLIFDFLREDGIEILPPDIKAKVEAIKARRGSINTEED